MKIILDTNVYFSAFVFDKNVLKLLDLCHLNYKMYISEEILTEIESKLFGDKIKRIHPEYNQQTTLEFFKKIKEINTLINPTQKVTICRDPDDNKFLELALEISADYLITGDEDLLELKQFESTKILKPSQFMVELNLTL